MTQITSSATASTGLRSPSWVEVDLVAVRANLRALRARIAPSHVIAVVKANAYGHGAVPVARAAHQGGAAVLAVACLQEGLELRQAGLTGPVLLLGAGSVEEAPEIVAHELTQALCRLDMAEALSRLRAGGRVTGPRSPQARYRRWAASACVPNRWRSSPAPVGVSRPGLARRLLPPRHRGRAGYLLRVGPGRLLPARPVPPHRFLGLQPGMRHLTNSAGTLCFPEMRWDAVRPGLLVYGIDPVVGQQVLPLRPALTWKTRVELVRTLPARNRDSYGRTYTTSGECLVGALPVGYADGFPRTASNRAFVLVRGQRCPVLGRACMDHIVVDLTPAGTVRVGEEVVILGEQAGACLTANDLAEWADTVVNEIPTRIGPRVQRSYVHEDASNDCDPTKKEGE